MSAEVSSEDVSFVFTDIEGSTHLLDELGDSVYADLLETHDSLVRSAIAEWGGAEVDNQGDAFFLAFPAALQAIAFTAHLQRALSAQRWPGYVSVRVRMAVHTGPAVVKDQRYVGRTVHEAARICAAAAGGQVLLSGWTTHAIRGRLPADLGLRDLGEFRLKDLAQSVPLVQLEIEGLASEFPRPRALDSGANILPGQLTSFVGRAAETKELRRLLTLTRLVTITGPGGTGKTRLAVHVAEIVARGFDNGACFVPLASVEDPDLVASAVAQALGLDAADDRTPRDRVLDYVRERHLLLVFDNFEHVQDAAGLVAELLAESGKLVVMTTSRSPLHVYGEREFALHPLAPPSSEPNIRELSGCDSVDLFVQRASAVLPGFALTVQNAADVAEIVRQLDGLPLAIEIAAAMIKVFPARTLRRRLTERLSLLGALGPGAGGRHETLDAAIGWSYDLLDPQVQGTFARFSVFAGGADLDRAVAVCGGHDHRDTENHLVSLVDHSLLLTTDHDGEPRFSMLRTIRAFAADRLAERVEHGRIHDRHACVFLAMATDAEPALVGPEAGAHLDRLDFEHDNLRAALGHAVDGQHAALALALMASLWRFWQMRGHLAEGREAAANVLGLRGVKEHPQLHARALEAAGGIAYWQGDLDGARGFYEHALACCRDHGDDATVANALYNLSFVYSVTRSDPAAARRHAAESLRLYRGLGDRTGSARTLFALGNAAYFQDDPAAAREAYAECLTLSSPGGAGFLQSWACYMLALTEQAVGRSTEAEALYRQACRLFAASGDVSATVMCLNALADTAAARADLARAARLAGAAAATEASRGATLATFAVEQERREALGRLREVQPQQWAVGATLPWDDVIALALQIDPVLGDTGPTEAAAAETAAAHAMHGGDGQSAQRVLT